MPDRTLSKNIEAVHRGFLYQHLFAVGILLSADPQNASQLTVEGDEDIELLMVNGAHRYIQVKTRATVLRPPDVASTLVRFATLSAEHASGTRSGTPEFVIVSNVDVAPAVHQAIANAALQVTILDPSKSTTSDLPPAWRTLDEAIAWCVNAATGIPYTTLSPGTLVWKLATEVAFACAGNRTAGHSFRPENLSALFEQLVATLHRFPSPPSPYLPLENEPPFATTQRVRLVIGLSGAGKTAWAAESNLHSDIDAVYVNAADAPDPALPSTVGREVGAALLNVGVDDARGAVLPGIQPYEALGILSGVIARDGRQLLLVLDNVHRVEVETIRRTIDALPACRFLLLAQPWPHAPALQAVLGVHAESLPGFSLESIAAEFAFCGGGVDVNTADRVMQITGGLPLFVRDAALLAERYYGHNAVKLCDDLEAATNATTTGQEAILGQVAGRLSGSARNALALLGLSEVPLTVAEAAEIVADALGGGMQSATVLLRELSAWGIAQQFGDGSLQVHDAFGVIAHQARIGMTPERLAVARRSLARVLRKSFGPGKFERLVMFLKIAPLIGETETVIDVVTGVGEHLQERGKAAELLRIVDAAADDPTISPPDRFWAADAALFWTLDGYSAEEIDRRVVKLESSFSAVENPSQRVRSAFLLKKLLIAGRHRRLSEVYAIYRELRGLTEGDETLDRILRYDFAAELYRCDASDAAYCVLSGLVGDYLRAVGLTPKDLFMNNPAEIGERVKPDSDQDDLKRLADTLDLVSRVVNELGARSGVLRIWAHKLYLLAAAYRSAVKVGQEVVDELLSFADPASARRMIELTLIPLVREMRLLAYMVPVQSQYAVVLAYMGQFAEAYALLDQLATFEGASEEREGELRNQRELVGAIERGEIRLRLPAPGRGDTRVIEAIEELLRKTGRNQACLCGSGLKFKRCCGRAAAQPLVRLLLPHLT